MGRPAIPDERILRAAADLFGERGYRGTTTKGIAQRAGVNEATIFRKFGNKQGVLKALAAEIGVNRAGAAVADLPQRADTCATLTELARMEVTGAGRFGSAAMRLAVDARAVPEVDEVMGDGPRRNLEGLAGYLAERQSAGDLRRDLDPWLMAESFFALTSTLMISRQILGLGNGATITDPDAVIFQVVDLFCSGVVATGRVE